MLEHMVLEELPLVVFIFIETVLLVPVLTGIFKHSPQLNSHIGRLKCKHTKPLFADAVLSIRAYKVYIVRVVVI